MSEITNRKIDTGRLTGGIVMITIGVLFLLSRLNIAEVSEVVRRYWPMFVVAVGVPKLFSRDTVWGGLWLIAIGVWLQMCRLEILGLTYASAWPLLLIILGAGMVMRAFVEAIAPRREERHEG